LDSAADSSGLDSSVFLPQDASTATERTIRTASSKAIFFITIKLLSGYAPVRYHTAQTYIFQREYYTSYLPPCQVILKNRVRGSGCFRRFARRFVKKYGFTHLKKAFLLIIFVKNY
jgi:hypothetical protein